MAGVMVLAAWTDWFTQSRFLSNTVWQWLALLGVLLGSFVAGKVVSFVIERHAARLQRREHLTVFSMMLRSLSRPVTLLPLAAGLYLAGQFMTLRDPQAAVDIEAFWNQICKTLAILAAGWFIYRLIDVLEFYLLRWTSKTDTALDDQLVPLIRKSLRVFVVIVAILFIAQNIFNWDIGALIAGLGIGGLAFALAAKDMLANFFGSVTIFADRPFQMGDWVRLADYEGTVEEVGFRSTRIRTFFGHLVTVPNAMVANSPVENVGRRPYIRRNLNVTVTYDTPPAKLQRGIDLIREMLEARREHWPEDRPPKVLFSDFNAASLNLLVVYWYTPPDYWQSLAFNHDFNMELLRGFNEAGIEFAFPTQTLYVKQDSPIEADVRIQNPPRES